jgi:hypothetical protein
MVEKQAAFQAWLEEVIDWLIDFTYYLVDHVVHIVRSRRSFFT